VGPELGGWSERPAAVPCRPSLPEPALTGPEPARTQKARTEKAQMDKARMDKESARWQFES